MANNAEGRTDGSLTPIDPATGKPGKPIAVDDPVQHVFHAGRTLGDRRRRSVQAARFPRSEDDGAAIVARRRPNARGINHADFSIDGRYAIFTCEFAKGLAKIDFVDRKVVGYLKLSKGGMPQDIRISPDGKVFYVADMMADGVFVVDGETFREIGFIATGKGTHGLYPSRDGRKLYVTNRGSNRIHGPARGKGSVSVVDFATRKVDVDVADSRRRQSRHGQRQRRRQAAVAVRPLRQRRLRVRHDERRSADDSGRQGAARPHGLAAARPLFARAHRQHALIDSAPPGIYAMLGERASVIILPPYALRDDCSSVATMTSCPFMYGRSAAGISIEPSARW